MMCILNISRDCHTSLCLDSVVDVENKEKPLMAFLFYVASVIFFYIKSSTCLLVSFYKSLSVEGTLSNALMGIEEEEVEFCPEVSETLWAFLIVCAITFKGTVSPSDQIRST